MPWKNGKGTTTEIMISPEHATLSKNDFVFRLSSASINENGDVIKEPTYEVESNIIPSFIKEYYQVDLGYGEPYYTNEAIMKSTENVIKDEDLKNNDNKK